MDNCEAPKRKQGRQTKYTPAKAKEILRQWRDPDFYLPGYANPAFYCLSVDRRPE